jgi:Uma2 family endonuclease
VTALTAPITELPESFRPLRREEYLALGEMGAFGESRVELVGGVVVEVAPMGAPHAGIVALLNRMLVQQTGERYVVSPGGPIDLDPISQPLPDLQVLPPADYRLGNPERALLIIEVAESSLRFDLGEKARRYAMASIPHYWVVDVVGRVVHVHAEPRTDGTWGRVEQQRHGVLTADELGLSVDLDELLDF